MSHLLYNTSFDVKSMPETIDDAIRLGIKTDSIGNYIFIVPTGKIVRHIKNKIIFEYHNATGKPLTTLNVFTLQTFVKFIFDKFEDSYKYHLVSDAYRLALFEEAAENAQLKFFSPHPKKLSSNLLKRLTEVVMGLKEDGILPQHFEKNIQKAMLDEAFELELARMTDIYALYSAYELIQENKFLDLPGMISLLTRWLNAIPETDLLADKIFTDKPLILAEGFTEFKMPELNFLSTFAQTKVPFAVNIEYDDRTGPLYTILEDSISRLNNVGFGLKETRNDSSETKNQITEFLKHNLFSNQPDISKDLSSIIRIHASYSRLDEVRNIARMVKHLILKEGYQPAEICVAMRSPNHYSELFREVFFTHQIPANITDRYELAKSPVSVGVISLLELVINGFRFEDLVKVIKNPFISISYDDGTAIDADNLIATAIALRIRGGSRYGKQNWQKRISDAIKALSQRIDILGADEFSENFEIIKAEQELVKLKKASEDFNLIAEYLNFDIKSLSPDEFAHVIVNHILERFHIISNIDHLLEVSLNSGIENKGIKSNEIMENAEKSAKSLGGIIQIVDEMKYVLNDRFSSRKFRFEDLADRFKTSISGAKYQTFEKIGYGVTVTTIEQTRRIPYKVMILCGAIDGEFPVAYKPETFLGMELPDTEIRHILSERIQFYQLLTNAPDFLNSNEKRIFITYPKTSDDRDLVRSPFVDNLIKITTMEEDGNVHDLQKLSSANEADELNDVEKKQLASIPWINSIASEADLQDYYGVNLVTELAEQTPATDYKENIPDKYEFNYIKRSLLTLPPKSEKVKIDFDKMPADIIEKIEKYNSHSFSVTELELYASCPYKFFLRYIIGLGEPEEMKLMLSPIEKGVLMHSALYIFYSRLQKSDSISVNSEPILDCKTPGLPLAIPVYLNEYMFDDYRTMFRNIVTDLLNEIRFEHPFFTFEEEFILGIDGRGGLADIWMKEEFKRLRAGWASVPVLFEFSFGMKSSKGKASIPAIEIADGIKIKGKIDRIEIDNSGEERSFIIADYKTSDGGLPTNTSIMQGKKFQVPLYIIATRQILMEHYQSDIKSGGGVYYILNPKYKAEDNKADAMKCILVPRDTKLSVLYGEKKSSSVLKKEEVLEYILNDSVESAIGIVKRIRNGEFDVEPDKTACTYCSFGSICRIKDR